MTGGESGGLGDDWASVVRAIEALGPKYPAVNRVISLGLDRAIRILGIRLSGVRGGKVLDAGAGDGSLSVYIQEELGGRCGFLVMLDPSERMIRLAMTRVKRPSSDAVIGVLEYAPFRPSSIGSVFMAFALRDVFSLPDSLERLASILKPGGVFTVIDLAKPDGSLAKAVLSLYWRIVAPFLVASALMKLWREIRMIYPTYLLLPTESELIRRLARYFRLVRVRRLLLGGVHILVLRRPHAQGEE
ncbi:Demethylmenaquinone methyltransferase [Candidatus Calditenuaceae archaeon HR02]|nr:Demethylmenaquinone methyltransferase [Candidatus Calditenuaceae archaeon HR02]